MVGQSDSKKILRKKEKKISFFLIVYFVFLIPTAMKATAIAPTEINKSAPFISEIPFSDCGFGAIRGE